MNNAYTYNKAVNICIEYKSLTGCALCGEYRGLGLIEEVAVAPADDRAKHEFLEYYKAFNDVEKALSFFDTEEYDVVLISRNNEHQVSIRDLRAHLAYQSANSRNIILD